MADSVPIMLLLVLCSRWEVSRTAVFLRRKTDPWVCFPFLVLWILFLIDYFIWYLDCLINLLHSGVFLASENTFIQSSSKGGCTAVSFPSFISALSKYVLLGTSTKQVCFCVSTSQMAQRWSRIVQSAVYYLLLCLVDQSYGGNWLTLIIAPCWRVTGRDRWEESTD